jgi:hypothetical protein
MGRARGMIRIRDFLTNESLPVVPTNKWSKQQQREGGLGTGPYTGTGTVVGWAGGKSLGEAASTRTKCILAAQPTMRFGCRLATARVIRGRSRSRQRRIKLGSWKPRSAVALAAWISVSIFRGTGLPGPSRPATRWFFRTPRCTGHCRIGLAKFANPSMPGISRPARGLLRPICCPIPAVGPGTRSIRVGSQPISNTIGALLIPRSSTSTLAIINGETAWPLKWPSRGMPGPVMRCCGSSKEIVARPSGLGRSGWSGSLAAPWQEVDLHYGRLA